MKSILFTVSLLLTFTLHSQIIVRPEVINSDGQAKIIVSDSSEIVSATIQFIAQKANKHARLFQRLKEEDFARIDNQLTRDLVDMNLRIDSIQNARFGSDFLDTLTMRIRTSGFTNTELLEFTSDTMNVLEILNIDVFGFFNRAGRLVLRPVYSGSGRWPVFFKSFNYFEIVRFPQDIRSFVCINNSGRKIFVDEDLGPWKIILISK